MSGTKENEKDKGSKSEGDEPGLLDRAAAAAVKTPGRQIATGVAIGVAGTVVANKVVEPVIDRIGEAIANRGKEKAAEHAQAAAAKGLAGLVRGAARPPFKLG
jgi:hypothetical protein